MEDERWIRRGITSVENSLVYKIIIILAAVAGLVGLILTLISQYS